MSPTASQEMTSGEVRLCDGVVWRQMELLAVWWEEPGSDKERRLEDV